MGGRGLTAPLMLLHCESDGRQITLDPACVLGTGGEATVYSVDEAPNLAAKVYHKPTDTRARKLLAARIAQGQFPYSLNKRVDYQPAAVAPYPDTMTPRLQQLFSRCFEDGHDTPQARPSPEAWQEALLEVEDSLVACPANSQHGYAGLRRRFHGALRLYPGHGAHWLGNGGLAQSPILRRRRLPYGGGGSGVCGGTGPHRRLLLAENVLRLALAGPQGLKGSLRRDKLSTGFWSPICLSRDSYLLLESMGGPSYG